MHEVRICPKCKSRDVSNDLSVASYAQGAIFNKYICNNCGYNAMFFPVVKHLNKRVKKK